MYYLCINYLKKWFKDPTAHFWDPEAHFSFPIVPFRGESLDERLTWLQPRATWWWYKFSSPRSSSRANTCTQRSQRMRSSSTISRWSSRGSCSCATFSPDAPSCCSPGSGRGTRRPPRRSRWPTSRPSSAVDLFLIIKTITLSNDHRSRENIFVIEWNVMI